MNDSSLFGETAKMFENVNTDDLKSKLDEAFQNIENLFGPAGEDEGGADAAAEGGEDTESESDDDDAADAPPRKPRTRPENPFTKFDAETMHNHINQLLNGKLGTIAKELAEEISQEINDDLLNMMDGKATGNMMNDTQAFLAKLKENPGKMMDLVKKIVGKLRAKMDSGELNQEDFMKELSGIMENMKNIPGFGGMENILKQFARKMGGGGGGAAGGAGTRIDTNAIERMSKHQQMKEKLRARMEMKNRAKMEAAIAAANAAATALPAAPAAPVDDSWMDEPAAPAAAPAQQKKSKKSGAGKKK
jgi:hypothetical protein